MRMILITVLTIPALFLSCNSRGMDQAAPKTEAVEADYYAGEYAEEQAVATSKEAIPPQQPVLLRTADCRMEVEHVQDKVKLVEALLTQKSGYLANLEWRNYGNREEARMSLRVPAEHFNWLLDTIARMAVELEYQEISTSDVTEEYVDLQSRLKTKKAVRDRYEEILRTRAKTVEDILKTEEQLRRLQEEIEAQEGRLRYLSQRAELSTISLQLYEVHEEEAGSSWWKELGEEVLDSLSFSLQLIKEIVLGLISLWPLVLLAGWLIWRRKKIWQRLHPGKKAEKND